jgi:hypothetical protein
VTGIRHWRLKDVRDMRRYLLVLDRDLATADEPRPAPVNYLAARQEEEPCQVVVLALVRSRKAQVPAFMRLRLSNSIGRYGRTNLPQHDVIAAEHRMNSAVFQVERVGCHAAGVITRQRQLGLAVRGEIHGRHYDEVLLVTGRSSGTWLARFVRLDPVHRLRLRLGHRLTVFPLGDPAPQVAPVS